MDSEHRAFDIRGCNLPNGQHFRIVWSLDHGPISIGLGALFDYFWDTYFGTGYMISPHTRAMQVTQHPFSLVIMVYISSIRVRANFYSLKKILLTSMLLL